jgi:undecaprenyl-diphosphatase
VGFVPTGILGLIFHSAVKKYLLGNEVVVLWSLLLGGVAILFFERWHSSREKAIGMDVADITYAQAIGVGLFQSVAMIPGVSRSAATILGGLFLGLPRKIAVEFSFLLAVPTMAAATGLDLLKSYSEFSAGDIPLFLGGGLVAFIAAAISVKWLLSYVQKNDFKMFGWYRIIISLILAFFFLR